MKFKVLLKQQARMALLMFGAIFGFVTIGAAVIVLLLHPDDPAFRQVMFSMLMGYAGVFGLLGASMITINDGLSFAFQYGVARQTLLKSTLATFALVGGLALALVSVAEALSQPVVGFAWTLLPGLNPGPLQLGLLWLLVMAVCSLEGWLFLVTLRLRPARRFKVVMSGLAVVVIVIVALIAAVMLSKPVAMVLHQVGQCLWGTPWHLARLLGLVAAVGIWGLWRSLRTSEVVAR